MVHLVRHQGSQVYALKQIKKEHYRNKNHMKAAWLFGRAVGNVVFPVTCALV